MGMKPIHFKYKIDLVKEIRLVGYNSPHVDTREAELDIDLAIETFGLKDRVEEGVNHIEFDVDYIPDPEGFHTPYFRNLSVEKTRDNIVIKPEQLSILKKIKRYFRRFKVKRSK